MDPAKHPTTAPVVDWIFERGYIIEPGRAFAVFHEEKTITYRPQDRVQTQLRGLLHECGHILVSESLARNPHGVRFKRGYPSARTGKARSNVSAADVMHEEIEAWQRGFELAQRLCVPLDEAAFWKDYGVCIKSYCRGLLKRKV